MAQIRVGAEWPAILPRQQWRRGSLLGVSVKQPKENRCDCSRRQNDQRWPRQTVVMCAWYHALRQYCRFRAVSTVQTLLRHGCQLRRGRRCRILMRPRRRSPLGLAYEIAEAPRQTRGGKPPGRLQNGEKAVRRHREIPAIPGTRTILHCVHLNDCSRLSIDPPRFSAPMLGRIIALPKRKGVCSSRNLTRWRITVRVSFHRLGPLTGFRIGKK
jgi:hypothetical protein